MKTGKTKHRVTRVVSWMLALSLGLAAPFTVYAAEDDGAEIATDAAVEAFAEEAAEDAFVTPAETEEEAFVELEDTEDVFTEEAYDSLPLATDLRWSSPGNVEFKAAGGGLYYIIELQRNQSTVNQVRWSVNNANETMTQRFHEFFTESGTYRFRVKTSQDPADWDTSTGDVTDWSPELSYTLPATKLQTPKIIDAVPPTFKTVDGAELYLMMVYADGAPLTSIWMDPDEPMYAGGDEMAFPWFYGNHLGKEISFQVKAFTKDLSVAAPSDWSDPVSHSVKGQWLQDENGWWYQLPDGTYPKNSMLPINDVYYCFDENGYMKTGWHDSKGYINGTETTMWHYFTPSGAAANGWYEVDGAWYYFGTGGTMITGWIMRYGKWYYLRPSGEMVTGWEKVGDTWYYMDENGVMQTGWVQDGKTWYYMRESGAMATGWVWDNGTWYFMDENGAMVTGWVDDDGTWYYMDSTGAMFMGWVQSGSAWYYMKTTGEMATGWVQDNGTWYFMDKNGAMIANTSRKINGTTYNFNASGACTNP